MRAFLNSIFSFIGSESLTDAEFAALPQGLAQDYSKATYDALKTVILGREGVSSQLSKLGNFFKAKGVDLTESQAARPAASQILVGAPLQ